MIEIIRAKIEDISIIQNLSNTVWPATFKEILSAEQIKYMMEMMYSTDSLKKQMEEQHHQYVLAKEDTEYLGYLAIQHQQHYTKIHKIYVLPNLQGKGVGRKLIEYARDCAADNGYEYLTLNVNRYNKALDFYKHLGFAVDGVEDNDIGNGYLMEDYIMKMNL